MALAVPTLCADQRTFKTGYAAPKVTEQRTRLGGGVISRGAMRGQGVQTAWSQQSVGLYGAVGDGLFHQ